MAALTHADAATFSWGSFSWWVARLTRGSVLYDRGLRNSTWLETSGCGALVFGGGGAGPADARRFADDFEDTPWVRTPEVLRAKALYLGIMIRKMEDLMKNKPNPNG